MTEARVRGRTSARSKWIIGLRDIVIIVVVAVLVSFLIKTFVARSFYVPSASMENTLQINDRIVVNELQPRPLGLARGDVVVFADPGGWLPPAPPPSGNTFQQAVGSALDFVGLGASDSRQYLVKRLIGLPGDHVTCCDAAGRMSVNGVALTEPYVLLPPGVHAVSSKPFDVVVPPGRAWVMGDNRYDSADSRFHMDDPDRGFVPESDIVGHAFVIVWPATRWSWLSSYPETFEGVDRQSSTG